MNTKELLIEWKKFLNEEVKTDIYFEEKGDSLNIFLNKYKLDHGGHEEYPSASPYEKAHFDPGSNMKKMVKGIEFTSKVAIYEQTHNKGEIYILKNYEGFQRPVAEHLVPVAFYSSDIHRLSGEK